MAPPRIAEFVRALPVKPGMRVLEIGCGSGAALELLATTCETVLGIDRSAHAIKQAENNTWHLPAVKLRQVAIEDFELEPGERPYDLAFALRVGALDGRHLELEARALARIGKALRKGGRLFVDGGEPLREIRLTPAAE